MPRSIRLDDGTIATITPQGTRFQTPSFPEPKIIPDQFYRLWPCPTPHGWAVSLTVWVHTPEGERCTAGFTLITFPSEAEQMQYVLDLSTLTGWEIETR